jgi:hypothetical protein
MKILLLLSSLISFRLFAHGTDKPGPNGGHIRMIGTIHTELVMKKTTFDVYLLDIGFKNETVKNSKVKATIIEDGQKSTQVDCKALDKRFICELPVPSSKIVAISLKVVRDNYSPKISADYVMPLNFKN